MAKAVSLYNKNPFKAKTISALLIKFSAPAAAGMFVNALYNIISRVYVGQEMGSLGIAGITILFPLGLFFMGFSALIGVGSNALFSIRMGEKKEEDAQIILGNAFILLTLVSALLTLLTYLFMEPLLLFLGADSQVLPYAKAYTQVVLPGYFLFAISIGLNNFIRSGGHPKTAMATQFIGALINLVTGPIFIFALKWGMQGAALATVCGQAVSFLWVILFFTSKRSQYRLRWRYFKLRWSVFSNTLYIGFSQFTVQIGSSALNIILNYALLHYGGNVAISAVGIAISVNTMIIMPVIGLAQGAQPLIGYNYGAKKYKTSIQTLKMALRWGVMICSAGFLLTEIFAPQIVSIFDAKDTELMRLACYAVRMFNLMLPLLAVQILTTSFFQAVNKPLYAAVLSLSRQVLLVIPLVLLLPLFFGLDGVLMAPPIADFISILLSVKLLKNYFEQKKQRFFPHRKKSKFS